MTWLINLIRRLFTWRIELNVPTLTDKEKRAALAVPESTPLWAAILAVIDEHLADAQAIVRAPQTAQQPTLLAHTAGGLDALAGLKEDLAVRRADAIASPQGL
jgi:hypothetical protein